MDPELARIKRRLDSGDSRVRELAADELSDLTQIWTPAADHTDLAHLAITHLAAETDAAVQEALANVISGIPQDLPLNDLAPLLPALATLNLSAVEYLLPILGATGDPSVEPILNGFLPHKHEPIRHAAQNGLAELRHRLT